MVPAGQSATFTVSRQGKPMQVKVTIGTRPDQTQVASNAPGKDGMMSPSSANAAGLGLSSLTPEAQARTSIIAESVITGAVVTKVDPDSDAADKGLQPGDVVLSVGNQIVRTPADSRPAWRKPRRAAASSVLLLVAHSSGRHRLCRHRYRQDMMRFGRGRCLAGHCADGGRAPPCRERGPLGEEFHRMRILVVEDDLEAQRYLVQGLKESGHVVDEAADGDTGLNLALSTAL